MAKNRTHKILNCRAKPTGLYLKMDDVAAHLDHPLVAGCSIGQKPCLPKYKLNTCFLSISVIPITPMTKCNMTAPVYRMFYHPSLYTVHGLTVWKTCSSVFVVPFCLGHLEPTNLASWLTERGGGQLTLKPFLFYVPLIQSCVVFRLTDCVVCIMNTRCIWVELFPVWRLYVLSS